MAMPSWVVIRHSVDVVAANKKPQEDKTMGRASKQPFSVGGDGEYDASWILRAVTLDAHLADPPEISILSLRVSLDEMKAQVFASVDSGDKNIVVIGVRTQVPIKRGMLEFLLIYEATKNSLSLVPHVANTGPVDPINKNRPLDFWSRTVVLPLEDGAYVLADLAFAYAPNRSRAVPSSGGLFLWWSSSSTSSTENKWVRKKVHFHPQMLPPILPPDHCSPFAGHSNFTFKDKAFWVDLRLGAVVFDLLSGDSHGDSAELRFINLPTDCPQWIRGMSGLPKNNRAMDYVGDSTRFVALVDANGCNLEDDTPPGDVVLRSWTLSEDQSNWSRDHDMTLPLARLFASRAFRAAKLPRCVPMKPVLKSDEDGIVYLLFADYFVNKHRLMRTRGGEHVVGVDMRKKTVVAHSHLPLYAGWHSWQTPAMGFVPEMPEISGAKFCSYITDQARVLPKKRKPGFLANERKRHGKQSL